MPPDLRTREGAGIGIKEDMLLHQAQRCRDSTVWAFDTVSIFRPWLAALQEDVPNIPRAVLTRIQREF
jgi:hypothetical protein